jgi:hypothetical protein
MLIHVTQEDINNGEPTACMVDLALRRALQDTSIRSGFSRAISSKTGKTYIYKTSIDAYIRAFDMGLARSLSPFTFEIEEQ